jgi:hypothetical protein
MGWRRTFRAISAAGLRTRSGFEPSGMSWGIAPSGRFLRGLVLRPDTLLDLS